MFVFVLDSPKYEQAEPFPEVAVLKPQGIVKNLEFQGESSSELQDSSTSQNLCTIDVRSAFLRVPSSRFLPNKRRCFWDAPYLLGKSSFFFEKITSNSRQHKRLHFAHLGFPYHNCLPRLQGQ